VCSMSVNEIFGARSSSVIYNRATAWAGFSATGQQRARRLGREARPRYLRRTKEHCAISTECCAEGLGARSWPTLTLRLRPIRSAGQNGDDANDGGGRSQAKSTGVPRLECAVL
jgi:hypothetical protein